MDINKLVDELAERMGGQMGPVMAKAVDEKIRELGLD